MRALGALGVVALAVALAWLAGGCGAAVPSPADEAAVGEYQARQLACVAEAGTRLEADRCRCAVRVQFHRDCDGGVP